MRCFVGGVFLRGCVRFYGVGEDIGRERYEGYLAAVGVRRNYRIA